MNSLHTLSSKLFSIIQINLLQESDVISVENQTPNFVQKEFSHPNQELSYSTLNIDTILRCSMLKHNSTS